ncbi:hypothetical protein Q766_16035 [Flavobacterium subsaxonicum WB 4.1-42 = DSM 21790]|uniref:Uncharacterized protein n=1 Tax=Flavobacterium subsaxonicum WB 4.1-42 = DSM 21790 TaxID=1121898 RepID=A0A0A2MJK6_9FLAO|nr:hypothetical protein Q766_16035 [Flavobacterium subsaxonicum WB 4.1-42 = DSM 21790]
MLTQAVPVHAPLSFGEGLGERTFDTAKLRRFPSVSTEVVVAVFWPHPNPLPWRGDSFTPMCLLKLFPFMLPFHSESPDSHREGERTFDTAKLQPFPAFSTEVVVAVNPYLCGINTVYHVFL